MKNMNLQQISDWTIKILIFLVIICTLISFITYLIATVTSIYANFYVALDNGVLDVLYLNI
jgi:hypothetical protein